MKKLLALLALLVAAPAMAYSPPPTCADTGGQHLNYAAATNAFSCGSTAPTVALQIGTSSVGGGTSGRILFDNAGLLGEYAITGTGNVVMSASPTLSGTVAGTYTLGGSPSIAYNALTGMGSGLSTFLGAPSSANLLNALTTSTGTGNAVFSASPTLSGTITGGTFSGTHTGGGSGLTGIGTASLGGITGTPSSTTFLSGNGTWETPAAGGGGTVTSIATTSPITGGTITATGTIACATCATTTNGGALSGTAPIAVSAGGVISLTNPLPVANGGTAATTVPAALGSIMAFPLSTATYPNGSITGTTTNASGTDPSILTPILSTLRFGANAAGALAIEENSVLIGNYTAATMNTGCQNFYETGSFTTQGNCFHNIVMGTYAMGASTAASATAGTGSLAYNVVIGSYAGMNLAPTATGQKSSENVFIGDHNSQFATTGNGNVDIGGDSAEALTTGGGSVIVGVHAGGAPGAANSITGNYNTLLGFGTGLNLTSGASNLILGPNMNSVLTTGSSNILIGVNATTDVSGATVSNTLNIGNLVYGIGMTGSTASPAGQLGIGIVPNASYAATVGATSVALAIKATSTSGFSGFDLLDSTGAIGGEIIYGNSASVIPGLLNIFTNGTANIASGTGQTGLFISSGNLVGIGTSSPQATMSLTTKAPILVAGTKFTISGCSAGTTVGQGTAGKFSSGTTGTCTVVITINGATGSTAPNGWNCGNVADTTTVPALFTGLMHQTGDSTTTCTVSGTTVSGDVIKFVATPY